MNEAVTAASRAYETMRGRLPSSHPTMLMYVANLTKCYEAKGTKAAKMDALALYVEAARALDTTNSQVGDAVVVWSW